MTGLVGRKMINGRTLKLAPVMRKVIGDGVLKLERVQVICPACGQQVEAVAADGRVKGYCTVAEQYVEFPIQAGTADTRAKKGSHLTVETKAKIPATLKGKPHTAETKAKISATLKGKPHTTETKAKISVARKGSHLTVEHRAKISATRKGSHPTAETKAKISAALTRYNTKRGLANR